MELPYMELFFIRIRFVLRCYLLFFRVFSNDFSLKSDAEFTFPSKNKKNIKVKSKLKNILLLSYFSPLISIQSEKFVGANPNRKINSQLEIDDSFIQDTL
jgi:hypothetical protein